MPSDAQVPFIWFQQPSLVPGFNTELSAPATRQLVMLTDFLVTARFQSNPGDGGVTLAFGGAGGVLVGLAPVNELQTAEWKGAVPIGGGAVLFIGCWGSVGKVEYDVCVVGAYMADHL